MKGLLLTLAIACLPGVRCQEAEDQTDVPDLSAPIDDMDSEDNGLETDDDFQPTIIITGSGALKGKKFERNGKDHYEFLGIPFAEPPVGKLRFQPPVPVSPWSDVREAFSDGPVCIQEIGPSLGANYANLKASEDCLTLNIFTNSIGTQRKAPKAVMLWIHGGGYTTGSKDQYRMQRLVDEDIVYVAINYRLSALGFMSFGNDLVSGNMGLRDQHLAIQWVRANIHLFGGDPDKITIFGESAGGGAVHSQVLSPANRGLLAGAIAQSGNSLLMR